MAPLVKDDVFEESFLENAIPPRPLAVEMIAREIDKQDPDFRLMERVLVGDVAIAGALLKTVNSPFFGLRRHVHTVKDALMLMGVKSVAQVVACVSLRSTFPSLRFERFWDASMKIAALSSWFAKEHRLPGITPDLAYTYGLFRDSGIAVISARLPKYQEVLAAANADLVDSFTDVERRFVPVSHAQVGAMLAQTWWLPNKVTEAIRHHHNAAAIEPVASGVDIPYVGGTLIAVSQLAEQLLQQSTGLSQTKEWQKLGPACLRRLSMDEREIPKLVVDARLVLRDI